MSHEHVAPLPSASLASSRFPYAAGKSLSGLVTPVPSPMDLAVLSAVTYASIFDYPLTLPELRRALSRRVTSDDALRRAIDRSFFLRSRLTIVGAWVLPAGRTDLIGIRKKREGASRAFLASHRRTLAVLCSVPFTRLVAISGSLAHLNAGVDADLDLFVVAADGRVWTATVLMLVAARLLRRRRVVCVNFVLGLNALRLDQTDFFTAHQVLSLRPVAGEAIHRAFLEANPFVRQHFPNADEVDARLSSASRVEPGWPRLKRLLEAALWLPGAAIERVCRAVYEWHLQCKMASWHSPDQVRLETNVLKLHTRSHRHEVLSRHATLMASSPPPSS